MTATAAFTGSFAAASPAPHSWRLLPARPIVVTKLLSKTRRQRGRTAEVTLTPPGPIGAAVITASRHSLRLSQRELAERLAVPASALRNWETGSTPLYCTDFGQLRLLAAALRPADGNEARMLHTLLLASQCDLLITGMLRGFEDFAEVPPIEEDTADGEATRELLRWAFTGVVPAPYREQTTGRVLLAHDDVTRLRGKGLLLQAGGRGDDLRVFGCTLAVLTKPSHGREANDDNR